MNFSDWSTVESYHELVTSHFQMTLTSDLKNSSTMPYQRPFSDSSIIVTASIIFLFLVIGVIGNGLTILVIRTHKSLNSNVFMRFILSLCVSDLISALISWLFLYRRTWGFDRWSPIPGALCTFYWSADLMTSYVTALHILSFGILRLISIKKPHFYSKITLMHSQIWITIIWITCFLCGFVPSLTIFGAGIPDRSSSRPNARWPACTVLVTKVDEYQVFQNITFPVFLYIPTIGIIGVCLYIILLVKLRSNNSSESKKEKQAILQLVLIISGFLIGYLPFTAYEFWSIQTYPNEPYYNRLDYWFGMIEYLCLRFSECLNPLFYNLGSRKMRKYTRAYLKQKFKFFLSTKSEKKNGTKMTDLSCPPTAVTQDEARH